MISIPENLFCLVSFPRIIAFSVQPGYIQKLGLIPCLIDSIIHLFIAQFTHSVYLYFAEKLDQLDLVEIVTKVLGKKWRDALRILGCLNFNGLIMTYVTQIRYHIEEISTFIDANSYFEITMTVVFFLLLIFCFFQEMKFFIRLQWVNAFFSLIILVSIIAIGVKSLNNNVFDHLLGSPSWYDIPSYFISNNFTYHNLIYAIPFLVKSQNTRKIVNKSIFKITNYTNFIQYFIFGIFGYAALDLKNINNSETNYIFLEQFNQSNLPTFLLHISFLYMSLWGCGFHFIHLKQFFKDFLINPSNPLVNANRLKLLGRVFTSVYIVISLGFYSATKFQLQPYAYVIANISYLFILILLPYNLTYYPKIMSDKIVDFSSDSMDTTLIYYQHSYSNLIEQNQLMKILNRENNSNQTDPNNSSANQVPSNHSEFILSNVNESLLSKKTTQQVKEINNQKKQVKIIFKKAVKERRNKYKYWIFGVIVLISYIMTIMQLIYFYYQIIFY